MFDARPIHLFEISSGLWQFWTSNHHLFGRDLQANILQRRILIQDFVVWFALNLCQYQQLACVLFKVSITGRARLHLWARSGILASSSALCSVFFTSLPLCLSRNWDVMSPEFSWSTSSFLSERKASTKFMLVSRVVTSLSQTFWNPSQLHLPRSSHLESSDFLFNHAVS